jgi:pyruvate-formate lyase-activating enzyme
MLLLNARLVTRCCLTTTNKRFDVISIQYDDKCSLNCKNCYAKKKVLNAKKPYSFFYEMVPYLAQLTPQVAIAGLEPLETPEFVKVFSAECKKHGLICNMTTNGKHLKDYTNKQLRSLLKNITMVALSLDENKVTNASEWMLWMGNLQRLMDDTDNKISVNLMWPKGTDKHNELSSIHNWIWGFTQDIQVNVLHEKPLNSRPQLTTTDWALLKHLNSKPNFYFDDCTRQLYKWGYDNWKSSCHAGKKVCSIQPDGGVGGCSFVKPEFYLDKPSDILKAKTFKFKERKCYEDVR